MGLIVSIYRDRKMPDCSAGGLSSRVDEVTLVNVEGPFDPTPERPAALLVKGNGEGIAKVVEAVLEYPGEQESGGTGYVARKDGVGPSMGGCYVATSDSRFTQAVERIVGGRFYGAVPLHDRYETAEQYADLSRD
jgi:hypothetical protein